MMQPNQTPLTNFELSSIPESKNHSLQNANGYKMKNQSLCLSLLLLFIAATQAARLGGWSPIKNLNDAHVKEIGEFAVEEYNKESNAELKLESVVKGETQVVSGSNYRLVLSVKEGGVTKNYEAVVWEKPWQNFRKLTSFKPVKA